MNSNMEDVGVLLDFEMDMAFGADENNFECTVQADSHCCDAGYFLYIEGTEYGGIVDSITSDTAKSEVVYSGRTWHGILDSKILEPDSGQAYLVVSGDANTVIGSLIERMALTNLFTASSEESNLTIDSYQIHRYVSGYNGIRKMLESVGAKLCVTFENGKVTLSAKARHDYSQDDEFDSDLVEFKAKKNFNSVNHLVCLGSGELENRTVVHLYVDAEGNISQTQTQFGNSEYAAVFNYPNAESEEELVSSGKDNLKSLWATDEMSIDFDASSDVYDIGDIVGAIDNITQFSVVAAIAKKIVTIKNGQTTISYKVGD